MRKSEFELRSVSFLFTVLDVLVVPSGSRNCMAFWGNKDKSEVVLALSQEGNDSF